ncbi:MAG: hypothetical protein LBC72_04235, partial [Spirochaetaceae bacterium]|nr:hypothetical protein [Spirochaetaceae bacterium]
MTENAMTRPKDCFGITGGLSATHIKITGVVMMVFDHVYYMFQTQGIPQWFHWIGRPVAPLFLFMCAEGFAHTRSRKRYILQLLAGYEIMNVVSFLLGSALPNENVILIFSIFGSLFFAALYMLFADMFRRGIQTRRAGISALAFFFMLIPAAYGLVTVMLLSANGASLPRWASLVLFKLVPNVMMVEGSLLWVVIALLFYLLRKNRLLQILPLAAFGAVFFALKNIEWL